MDLSKLLALVNDPEFGDVLEKVLENRAVLQKIGDLPAFFDAVASGLDKAGEQARNAAAALVGDDGTSGARATLDGAAEALGDIVGNLGKGAALIADAAEGVAKVPLMDGPAKKFSGAADALATTNDRLGDLAKDLASLAGTLEVVGAALSSLGDHLSSSGEEARGFLAS